MSKLEDIAYKQPEESDVAKAQMKEAYDLFRKMAFNEEYDYPIMCELHDVFSTSTGPRYDGVAADHNCLGCNFADAINLVDNFLSSHSAQTSIQHSHTTTLILFYLLVERMDMLLNLIKLKDDIRKEDFKILMEVRKWANFIKHPKAFILAHHPVFTFENAAQNPALKKEAVVCVDFTFVQAYYSNDEKNDKLFNELTNKDEVLVIYPALPRVAQQLCEAMQNIIGLLRDNAVFRRILGQKSTFTGYWIPLNGQNCPQPAAQ
jgi:hypothetical protein